MRSHGQRQLVVLMVIVSLALTGITVWAVAEQGRALQARERADLVSQAGSVAAQRRAALRAATELALEAALRAWSEDRVDGLDAWAAAQRDWMLAGTRSDDGGYLTFPRPPLDESLPPSATTTSRPVDTSALPPADPLEPGPPVLDPGQGPFDAGPLAALRGLLDFSHDPDALQQSADLLAEADRQQRLGRPLAAARNAAQAAQLLRDSPGLARFSFHAEARLIESLVAAGDELRTREAFSSFLARLLADHPARLSPAETTRLDELAASVGAQTPRPAAALAELRSRAQRRARVAEALQRALAKLTSASEADSDRVHFTTAATADMADERIVVAWRADGPTGPMALAVSAEDVLARYWSAPRGNVSWRVRRPTERPENEVLIELGPEFGGALIEATPTAEARLQTTRRRRLVLVLATILGMAGAWALVIWMMVRVVARYHELARLQGRFVADISHELKTPLALIRLLAETLADRRVRDPQRIQSYHETITRESERLTVLLDNILDLGRIESGRKSYDFVECDLGQVARQAWNLFEPRFSEAGFETRLELAENLPVIRADPQALQQVIVNLLQNAYRYSAGRKFVRLAVAREGYVIVITVEDHGIGMNRSELNRLGESFFRAEDARVRQTRGTGLGLAIVNHIVTAHRGNIDVHSRPGQGSTFSVWIPFEPQ